MNLANRPLTDKDRLTRELSSSYSDEFWQALKEWPRRSVPADVLIDMVAGRRYAQGGVPVSELTIMRTIAQFDTFDARLVTASCRADEEKVITFLENHHYLFERAGGRHSVTPPGCASETTRRSSAVSSS